MLMAPNDKIHEATKIMLWNVVAGSMLGTVLVQSQQIEPFICLLLRSHHLYLVLPEQTVQPFILD